MKIEFKATDLVKNKKPKYNDSNNYFFNVAKSHSIIESKLMQRFTNFEIEQSPYSNSTYIRCVVLNKQQEVKIRISDHECVGYDSSDLFILSKNGEFSLSYSEYRYMMLLNNYNVYVDNNDAECTIIKALTPQEAIQEYFDRYWGNDWYKLVDNKVFDTENNYIKTIQAK